MTSHIASAPDIEIIEGSNLFQLIPKVVSRVSRSLDLYLDASNVEPMLLALPSQTMIELKSAGTKFGCVTEITMDNLAYCKEMMKHFDLYHVPLLRGNFVIVDEKEYLGFIADENGKEVIINIKVPSFVAGQQFLLNNLVQNAISARQRIREIGKEGESEFMQTIREPRRIKALMLELIDSALYEISILFSNKKLFFIAEREGILDALGSLSEKGIKVKLLVMKDEADSISDAELKVPRNVKVNHLQQFLPTKITTIIIDESKSLVIEVNNDAKETFQEAIGLAQYSNSESTVFSNTSMFESLWIQSELDKQNKTKQVYFQMFRGFKLKDEVYNRRWSFEREKKKNGSSGD